MTTTKIRPHHLICNLCFQRKGYSQEFVENFQIILEKIKHPDTVMQIVNGPDDICAKCPHKIGDACQHDQKITKRIDKDCLTQLQLKIGDTITLESLKTIIKKLLTMDDFKNICRGCRWRELNICEPVLHDLINNTKHL